MAAVSTDWAAAAALHADVTRLYQEGDLHHARDCAERALLAATPSPVVAPRQAPTPTEENEITCHTSRDEKGKTDAPSPAIRSSSALVAVPLGDAGAPLAREHVLLFGNTLLLLSAIYTAVGARAEAERLLVTCEGYWAERLRCVSERCRRDGCVCACDRREGLAGVAYNRAVLELESLHEHTGAAVHAAWMADAVGGALDGPPVPPPGAVQPPHEQQRQQQQAEHERAVAVRVRRTHLETARELLSHTLGPQRCLLADVHHCCGVCHFYCGDYVAALEAWQQSLAIRVHAHRCPPLQAGEGGDEGRGGCVGGAPAHGSAEELKVALTLEHVAHVYGQWERRAGEALRLYDAVDATRVRLLGPSHPLRLRAALAKAVLAARLGKRKMARGLLDSCVSMQTHGDGNKLDAASHATLAAMEEWRQYLGTSV